MEKKILKTKFLSKTKSMNLLAVKCYFPWLSGFVFLLLCSQFPFISNLFPAMKGLYTIQYSYNNSGQNCSDTVHYWISDKSCWEVRSWYWCQQVLQEMVCLVWDNFTACNFFGDFLMSASTLRKEKKTWSTSLLLHYPAR